MDYSQKRMVLVDDMDQPSIPPKKANYYREEEINESQSPASSVGSGKKKQNCKFYFYGIKSAELNKSNE